MKEQLFTQAQTAYAFTDHPVTDAQLTELYDLVKYAPTPMNAQALRVAYVRTAEGKERLLPLLDEGNRAKSDSAAAVAILAYDTNFHEFLPEHFPAAPQAKDRFADAQRREAAAKEIASIQAGYYILAVRALGLDAGPMGGFNKEGVDAEFLAGTSWKSLILVNIGQVAPEGNKPRNPRLDAQRALSWH